MKTMKTTDLETLNIRLFLRDRNYRIHAMMEHRRFWEDKLREDGMQPGHAAALRREEARQAIRGINENILGMQLDAIRIHADYATECAALERAGYDFWGNR